MFKKSMLKIFISTVISICIILTFTLLSACEGTATKEVTQVEEATDAEMEAEETEASEEEIQEESTEEEVM